MNNIRVIGAGLAGCEAAWQIAGQGAAVELHEMKPEKKSPAHHGEGFAELVCSNSLKADRLESAGGLLKAEMRLLGSLLLEAADACRVPAGGALAVDRDQFSAWVTEKISAHPLITVKRGECTALPGDGVITIVATGPLTSDALAERISELCGGSLSFYDAAAPILTFDSIDMERAFFASRYDRGGGTDYINCPMNREEYEHFYRALVQAECAPLHEFDRQEQRVYEGCMPIEVMAGRGEDTMRFGPLKPVGLTDPRTGNRPWANVQLRRENSGGTLYNMVGFQTNLKFPEQKRVFSMIPALANAEFMRYGVMHRNTFIDSPRLLRATGQMKDRPSLFFAGQITGVEGYMESAASGILAGMNAARLLTGKELEVPPRVTMTGALMHYIGDRSVTNFQPMGANFGIIPPLEQRIRGKQERYAALSKRAVDALTVWNNTLNR